MKPFSAIPGPKSLPIIGTFYKYFPIFGEFNPARLHWTGKILFKKYGPIVKESYFRRFNLIHVFDTKDFELVYANDGKFPHRQSHKSLEKYRLERPNMYSSGGLLPTNGDEWWRIRQKSQAITKLPCITSQIPLVNQIYDEFLDYMDSLIDPTTKEIPDYIKYLQMVILEASSAIAIDDRIRFFGIDTNAEEADILRDSATTSTDCIGKLERGFPIWKWINTITYNKMTDAQDAIYKITLKYVEAKRKKLQLNSTSDRSETSVTPLEHFLLDDNLSNQDIMTIIGDVIIAGLETTAYSMVFVLYHIANNPDKQDNLYKEVKNIMGNSDQVTSEQLIQAKYTKAVIKESLRLNPASFAIGRQAVTDLQIKGYHVPKGSVILTHHMVASRLEENYTDADKFLPERWIDKSVGKRTPFASLPFGYGPRACLGRRLAEMTLEVLLMKMIRRYKLTYGSSQKLDVIFKLVNMPDGPLHLQFQPRN